MYLFSLKIVKNGSKDFASLLVGIALADKIGQKRDFPSLVSLCSFPNPYKISVLDPTGLSFYN